MVGLHSTGIGNMLLFGKVMLANLTNHLHILWVGYEITLWLNSSPLINGYNPFGMNSLSVWAWMFLFGHLIWATGFMFLISWRGYWQELNRNFSMGA